MLRKSANCIFVLFAEETDEKTLGKRGFVTLATGAERYYALAANLLHSYRFHTKNAYPFAIICDRENEKTKEYDHVIILDAPNNSYLDKLSLFKYLPYEETIFIDADSLAYGDLNRWWDLFKPMGDFSVFGYAYRDPQKARGWFRPDGMKEFEKQVSFIPDFNGGVYYLRNTETCEGLFQLAQHCAEHYHEYAFEGFRNPADEPVLALGMAVLDCDPLDEKQVVFAPKRKDVSLDLLSGTAMRKGSNHLYSLVHWSNYLAMKSLYRFEVGKMNEVLCDERHPLRRKLLYGFGLAYAYLWLFDLGAFGFRIIRKIRRIWNQKKKSISFFLLKT